MARFTNSNRLATAEMARIAQGLDRIARTGPTRVTRRAASIEFEAFCVFPTSG